MPVQIRVLGTIPKNLGKKLKELEITGRIKPVQITALLELARILRTVQES